jgi:hypothetical protein
MPSESQRLKCTATRRDGSPCRAWAVINGLCIGHQPNAAEARTRGGRNSSRAARAGKLVPSRLRPVLERLDKALGETHEGKLSSKQASAMASLARAIVAVYQADTLQERLEAVERVLKLRDGGKP